MHFDESRSQVIMSMLNWTWNKLSHLHALERKNKNKNNVLGNSPQMTFPVFHPHFPLQSWPKFSKPGSGDVVLALWVGRKATRMYNS